MSARSERFAGKVALVTGAASGIGRATARRLAAEGAKVLLADLDGEGAEAAAVEIRAGGGQAGATGMDVADPESVERALRLAADTYGGLDVAVNNAGIGTDPEPVGRLSIAGWQKVIAVNLSGIFYCMRAEIPLLLERGGGSIVNVSSVMGMVASANAAAYAASKHGVLGLTKAAALEYGPQGIRVTAIGPGFMVTPVRGQRPRDPERLAELEALHALRRLGEHEEIAAAICFLGSDEASFITGSFHLVDGGYTAR